MVKYKYTRSARIHLTVHEDIVSTNYDEKKVISTRGSRPLLLFWVRGLSYRGG